MYHLEHLDHFCFKTSFIVKVTLWLLRLLTLIKITNPYLDEIRETIENRVVDFYQLNFTLDNKYLLRTYLICGSNTWFQPLFSISIVVNLFFLIFLIFFLIFYLQIYHIRILFLAKNCNFIQIFIKSHSLIQSDRSH